MNVSFNQQSDLAMAIDGARAAKCGIGRQVTARKLVNHKGHEGTQRDLSEVLKFQRLISLAFSTPAFSSKPVPWAISSLICLCVPSCPLWFIFLFGYIHDRMKPRKKSQELHARASRVIPGGVDSPVRAFKSVGGEPPYIVRGKGSRIWDADGNEYIDYVGSWGPLILGHAFPSVVEAVEKANRDGASFGACTPAEAELAEAVIDAFPSMDKVRFVSSGTEATMSAIRLARAFTGRKYIVKFEGCYHGHADSLLVKAGSGVATLGIPGSAGVLDEQAKFTLALPFNSRQAVEEAFVKFKDQIACVIVEPVVGNMGCVPPRQGYLEFLRSITAQQWRCADS